MKQVNFITIGGTRFALPDDMTTKQKADFAGVCLQLQPLGSCYGHGWKDFYYVQDSPIGRAYRRTRGDSLR